MTKEDCPTEANLEEKRRWKKILWQSQPFPDNFTHDSFLIGLKTNSNVRFYVFNTAVRESALVSQQIGIVALFVVVAMFTIDATLPVEWLLILDLLLSFVFIFYTIEEASSPVQTRMRQEAHLTLTQLIYSNVRMFLLLFGALWGLSPVLKTLTTPISNDTIVALSVMFLLLHLLLHDYNDKNYIKNNNFNNEAEAEKSSSSTTFFRITPSPASLNAAIFASVLLSSRLESSLQAFALLFFSVELFAFSPYVRYKIKNSPLHSESAFTSMTVFITLLTTVLLFTSFSRLFAVLYLSLIAFISFICPFWLIWIQKYKNEINGPWDEAIPTPLKK